MTPDRTESRTAPQAPPLVETRNLSVRFPMKARTVHAVNGVDLSVGRGEIVGLVGESGSGKSVTCRALLGLLPEGAVVETDRLAFDGRDVRADPGAHADVRGRIASLVGQDPYAALNPYLTVSQHLAHVVRLAHPAMHAADVRSATLDALASVRIDRSRADAYPDELSGGMRQRVAIALAVARGSRLIVADEPTSSLDVTTEEAILSLLAEQRRTAGRTLLLVTHNLGIAREFCDRVLVMYAGLVVEEGASKELFRRATHPYTRRLISAVPSLNERSGSPIGARAAPVPDAPQTGTAAPRSQPRGDDPVLEVRDLSVHYDVVRGVLGRRVIGGVDALHGVRFSVAGGEVIGIVGETGAGKSTLMRAILRLETPSSGRVLMDGVDVTEWSENEFRPLRERMQVVFQNPAGALDPTYRVTTAVREPLDHFRRTHRSARTASAVGALTECGLDAGVRTRPVRRLSGGQQQRVGIARAIVDPPRLLLADEPVSALDVSVQAGVLALLARLVRERRFAMLFVTHDLAVVRQIADRVLVLREGRQEELTGCDQFFTRPSSTYGRALLDAARRWSGEDPNG